MTCRDKLKLEHPDCVNDKYIGGCKSCPDEYGYLEAPAICLKNRSNIDNPYVCKKCWDREIPGTEEDYDISTLINTMIDIAVKETNRHVTVKLDSHGISVNFYPEREKEN